MYTSGHSFSILQHQISSVLNKRNTVGCYNPAEDYSLSQDIVIGTMTEVGPNFKALKFKGETKGCAVLLEKYSQHKFLEVYYMAYGKDELNGFRGISAGRKCPLFLNCKHFFTEKKT
ncbi:hypothetical protein TNCV_1685381 [Trichonephila clavipes]|nr:hypothetical protein TNCV_1685381 [Trichonephila clavipes]